MDETDSLTETERQKFDPFVDLSDGNLSNLLQTFEGSDGELCPSFSRSSSADSDTSNYQLGTKGKYNTITALLLQDSLADLFEDSVLTDFDVTVGDTVFHCHKIVLCAVCNYFRSMFHSGMAESSSGQTSLPFLTPECFQSVLNYIYRGSQIFNLDIIDELLEASLLLQFELLESSCKEYMAESMTPSNCLVLYQLCKRHNCEDIADKAWIMCVTKFEDVMSNTDLQDLKEDTLTKLLTDKKLKFTSEDVLCKTILEWVKADLETRLDSLPELFNCICLPEVSGEFLYTHLYKNELIDTFPPITQVVDDAIKCHLIPAEKKNMVIKQRTIRDVKTYRRVTVVIGGYITDCDCLSNMSCWDDVSLSWYSLSSFPQHLGTDFASCVLENKIYVSGGSKGFDVAFCYDPADNTWLNLPKLSVGREAHAMVAVGDSLYVLGGRNEKRNKEDFMVPQVEAFKPGSLSWKIVGQLTHLVESFAVGVIGTQIFIYGGLDEDGLSKAISVFDVSTQICQIVSFLDHPHRGLTSVQIKQNNVYLISSGGNVFVHTGGAELKHLFHIPGFSRDNFALMSDGASIIIVGGKNGGGRLDTLQSVSLEDQRLTDRMTLGIPMDGLHAHSVVIPAVYLLQKGMSIS